MSDYRRQFSHRRVVSEGGAAWGYAPLHSVEAGEAAAASPFLSALHLGSASVTHSRAASFAEHPLPSLHEDSGSSSGRPSMSEEMPRPVEPAELEEAARVHSAASAPQLHDGTRLLQSLVVPPRMCWAFFCLLAAQALVLPLVFSDAVTGDALWGPFARPGTYLNVEVVRAQGLQLRHGASGSHPGDAETTSTQTTDASLLPAPYVNVVTWPWSKSGEHYLTQVATSSYNNFPLAPVWQESFTFDQSNQRARKVALWLKDASGTRKRRSSDPYAMDDPVLGVAMVPVPDEGAQQVSVTERNTGAPQPGIIEGWFPIQGPPRSSEADYEDANAPAVGEIYARVSFAERRATSGYCEQVRLQEPVAQPADSYSNFAFMVTGTHMLAVCASDAVRIRGGGWRAATLSGMQLFPVFSCLNGITQYYVGLGSFLFHASMTTIGQNLDMSGVYMLLGTPMLYMALRLGLLGPPHTRLSHLMFGTLVSVGAFVLYQYRSDLEYPVGGSTNLVLLMIGLLAGSVASWIWMFGSPPNPVHLSGSAYDEIDALLALPPSPTGSTSALDSTPPTTPHCAADADRPHAGSMLTHLAGVHVRRISYWMGIRSHKIKMARSSDSANMLLPDTSAAVPSSPLTSPRYMSRRERLALILDSLRSRSKPTGLRYRYCIAAVSSIAVAYVSRQMDVKYHVACEPTGWFQLHAVWHVLAAASLYFLWVFMRSEAPPTQVAPSETADFRVALASAPAHAEVVDEPDKRKLSVLPKASDAVPMPAASGAEHDVTMVVSPRGLTFPMPHASTTPRGAPAATGNALELAEVRSPRSRAASVLDMANSGVPSSMPVAQGSRDSGGGGEADAVVGVPQGAARAAAHLRTRSREVFGHDMV